MSDQQSIWESPLERFEDMLKQTHRQRSQRPVSNWFHMNENGVPGEITEHPYVNLPDLSVNNGCYMPVLSAGAVLPRQHGNLTTVSASSIQPFSAQACPCFSQASNFLYRS